MCCAWERTVRGSCSSRTLATGKVLGRSVGNRPCAVRRDKELPPRVLVSELGPKEENLWRIVSKGERSGAPLLCSFVANRGPQGCLKPRRFARKVVTTQTGTRDYGRMFESEQDPRSRQEEIARLSEESRRRAELPGDTPPARLPISVEASKKKMARLLAVGVADANPNPIQNSMVVGIRAPDSLSIVFRIASEWATSVMASATLLRRL